MFHNFFKKQGTKRLLAAALSMILVFSAVSPVYATELQEPVTETVTSEAESEVSEAESGVSAAESEAAGSVEASTEVIDEVTSNPYIILLPAYDGITYKYDDAHRDAELSTGEYDILLYEEGEIVSFKIKGNIPFKVVDVTEYGEFYDAADGKAEFAMPAKDLTIEFPVEETEADTENVPDTEVEEDVPDTEKVEDTEPATESEPQTQMTESEEVQTESIPETETATEIESETEIGTEIESETEMGTEIESETEMGTEIETETETETEIETEMETATEIETDLMESDSTLVSNRPEPQKSSRVPMISGAYTLSGEDEVELALRPKKASVIEAGEQYAYFKDSNFDYKAYIPESVDDTTNVSWEKGSIEWGYLDTYEVTYKVTWKEDPEYFWYITVPFELVDETEMVTVHSDGFENGIWLGTEQSDEYTGIIPNENGAHLDGPVLETLVGENFKLTDVNFGYDMNLFVQEVYDDDGFDPDHAGEYDVVYVIRSYENVDVAWYIDCKVIVKDAIENEGSFTVHVKSGELKATVSKMDGSEEVAAYGTDVITDHAIQTITVLPAWKGYEDISPEITVMKNGTNVTDEIILSVSEDNHVFTYEVNEDILVGSDSYVFYVDYPTYDPTAGGTLKSDDRRNEDFVDFGSDGEIALFALEAAATNTWTGKDICASLSNPSNKVTNYGWQYHFEGYKRWTMNFSSDFKKTLNQWVKKELGAEFEAKVPSSVVIQCAEGGGGHMAYANMNGVATVKVTATGYENSKGEYKKLQLKVVVSGAHTPNGNYQTYTGSTSVRLENPESRLTIVKSSDGTFSVSFHNVDINTSFGIYNDKACTKLVEEVVLLPDNKGEDARATVELDEGTYYVKEMYQCPGHVPNTKVYPINLKAGDDKTLNVVNYPYYFNGNFIRKVDGKTNGPLANAIFLVTAATPYEFIGEWFFKSDANGNIAYDAAHLVPEFDGHQSFPLMTYSNTVGPALPEGTVITAQEVQAPNGYTIDDTEYQIAVVHADGTVGAQQQLIASAPVIKNYPNEGYLTLKKKDKFYETVPDAKHYSLANAVYGVYNASGTKVGTLTTKEDGTANTLTLPAGNYTVREESAPKGYKVDTATHNVTVSIQQTSTVNVSDEPETGSLSISKSLEDMKDMTPEELQKLYDSKVLAGITFVLKHENPMIEKKNVVVDQYGKGSVSGLVYGKWTITEDPGSVPTGYKVMDPVTVTISAESGGTVAFSADNKLYHDYIEIVKKDAETKNTIPLSGVQFEIYDWKGDKVSLQVSGEIEPTTVFTTDSGGQVNFSEKIQGGKYVLKEITPPIGYEISVNGTRFVVDSDGNGENRIEVVAFDSPMMKRVSVTKKDAKTGNYGGAGYQFNVVTAEDIVDASGAIRKIGDKELRIGTVVETITTDENGIATSGDLYLGKYYIQEVAVPDEGLALNSTKYPFELKDEQTDEQPMVIEVEVPDHPTTLNLKKVDTVEGKNLEGITFRIKPKDAEDADDQLFTTDKDGNIKVEYLKKSTTYTVQEVETIPGYNLEDTVYEFEVDKDGLINGEYSYSITITNQPNEVHILKTDITTGKEIKGASLKITDMKGNVIDEWVSDGTPHVIYELPDGQYRLIETSAPEGYEIASAVKQDKLPVVNDDDTQEDSEKPDETPQPEEALPVAEAEGNADANGSEESGNELDTTVTEGNKEGIFTIVDSKVVQKITMEDSPYREVEVSKQDITNSKELPGCTLTIRDAENSVIDTWVSTEETHKVKLHSGLYTLTEEKPADGFVTAQTITFEVIQTTASDFMVMPVVMKDEVTKITVSKKDITNSEEIPGAHLTITNEAGEVVAEWTSTQEPHYIERLPIGKYTLTEVTAPENYEMAASIEFEIKDTDEIQHYEMFDSPFRDVEISKKDLTNEEEIAGAHMELKESGKDGKLIETWVSDGTPHKVKLPTGKYVLTETRPADGYVTADSITFEVRTAETTGDIEVQKVEMFDDITKVEISKQDVTNEKELPGAKLQIKDKDGNVIEEWTSTDKPHMIEMLPIGTYTLIETTAPKGYEVAEEVEFKVLDTAEIQHVIMYDSPTPEEVPAPQTGDIDMRIALAVIAVIVVLGGAGVVLIRKGKKKDAKDHNKE